MLHELMLYLISFLISVLSTSFRIFQCNLGFGVKINIISKSGDLTTSPNPSQAEYNLVNLTKRNVNEFNKTIRFVRSYTELWTLLTQTFKPYNWIIAGEACVLKSVYQLKTNCSLKPHSWQTISMFDLLWALFWTSESLLLLVNFYCWRKSTPFQGAFKQGWWVWISFH